MARLTKYIVFTKSNCDQPRCVTPVLQRIDMTRAYRGARNDDNEPETLGEAALEPDDIDSHGNRSRDGY